MVDEELAKADAAAAEEAAEEAATPVPEGVNGKGTADAPVILPPNISVAAMDKAVGVTEHVHTHDGECVKNTFGALCGIDEPLVAPDEPEPEPEREVATPEAPAAAPEPEKAATPAPAAPAAAGPKKCGDQPEKMIGKFPAVPGCEQVLSADNATKHQIAMLRHKTFLCDACLEKVS